MASETKKRTTGRRPKRVERGASTAGAPLRDEDPTELAPSIALRAAGTPKGDEVGAAELGRRVADSLRRIRRTRGLSLDQLAAQSGVSRAALSQIEGSRTNPTLAVLWKIAVGLGVPFGALLGDQGEQRCRLLRAEDIAPLRSVDGRVESRLLTPAGATPGHETYELRFAPRGLLSSEAHALGTHETIVMLTGTLRIVAGDETFDLAPGDAFHFRADVAHRYENRATREARFLNVIQYGSEA